jgi:hypothetical protein
METGIFYCRNELIELIELIELLSLLKKIPPLVFVKILSK